jgi:hypothetical protein
VGRFGGGADVHDVQERVRRRLEPDETCPLVDVFAERLVDRLRPDELELVALRLVDLREEAIDPAVDIVDADHALARVDEMHDRGHCGHPRPVRESVVGALE